MTHIIAEDDNGESIMAREGQYKMPKYEAEEEEINAGDTEQDGAPGNGRHPAAENRSHAHHERPAAAKPSHQHLKDSPDAAPRWMQIRTLHSLDTKRRMILECITILSHMHSVCNP